MNRESSIAGDEVTHHSSLITHSLTTELVIDSHAHIDGPEYDADRDQIIDRARQMGVTAILNVGTGDPHSGSLERAILVAEQYEEVFAAAGVHPHDARHFDEVAEARLKNVLKSSQKVIALGEIGLDYHYDNSPRETQRSVFARQLHIARERTLPVIIHSRESDDDTMDILEKHWSGASLPGIMHCFGGSAAMARRAIDLGFFISFAGNITFKKAEDLRNVAAGIPLERLLIETDCPYLSPVPYRGKRNEPARVVEVARCLATIHSKTLKEIGRITSENFMRIFSERL